MREKIAKWANEWYGTIDWDDMTEEERAVRLFEADELLAVLTEPQEPVAWRWTDAFDFGWSYRGTEPQPHLRRRDGYREEPLYLHPSRDLDHLETGEAVKLFAKRCFLAAIEEILKEADDE